jgi:hypothetical protein
MPLLSLAFAALPIFASDKPPKLKAEEIVAKHREAIATPEARAAVTSRSATGTVEFNERRTGRVHVQGNAFVLSQGAKFKCAFQFPAKEYPGEQLVSDGKTVQVAAIDQQNRSRLGNFIAGEPEVLQEGIWGGVLGTGWFLLNDSEAKLKSEGIKKIDGQELDELSVTPKKHNGQLQIHLYFDPSSFRHVMTIYRLTAAQLDLPQSGDQGGGQGGESPDVTTTVEERFSDFHAVGGITLPAQYEIRLRIEPSKGLEYQWLVTLSDVKENPF